MIKKQLLEELLGIAVSTGADFAEVFAEQERSNQIRLLDRRIESVRDFLLSGVGIRAFVGTKTYYASTSDTTRGGLLKCAAAVAGAIGDAAVAGKVTGLVNEPVQIQRVKHLPDDVPTARKAEILREASDAAVQSFVPPYDDVMKSSPGYVTPDTVAAGALPLMMTYEVSDSISSSLCIGSPRVNWILSYGI